MPLASRTGAPDPVRRDDENELVNSQTPVEMQSVLDHQPYIEDTFVNKTAFNPLTYAEDYQLIQRYTSGSRIIVTYFMLSTPSGGLQRSDAIDPSALRNPIQTSYSQINKFEITVMERGLQSAFDPEKMESKITGVALIYPGMKPRMGDLFVTPLGDSKFGIFQVTAVERLSYRQGSNHKITFFLREWATDAEVAVIKQSVTQELWFDKETYLGDATTLLKADSYRYLQTMRQMREILIRFYYNAFYDKTLSSIVSPDGVYDPYLVHYLTAKISIQDSIYRPTQLYPGLQYYENSLWCRLTDVTNRRLSNLQTVHNLVKYRVNRWDISVTALVNRVMVALDNPNKQVISEIRPFAIPCDPPPPAGLGGFNPPGPPQLLYIKTDPGYVLSPNFYAGDKVAMTAFELLVYAAIYDRRVYDIRDFIESYLNRYTELTLQEQYYYIPLYLWLIDMAVDKIAAPSDFMT